MNKYLMDLITRNIYLTIACALIFPLGARDETGVYYNPL